MIRKLKESLSGARFVLFGKKPWSAGYYAYKKKCIIKSLASESLDMSDLPKGFGHRLDERAVEYPWLFSRLDERDGALLDAGSVLNYDYIITHKKLTNKKITIMTLAPEPYCFYKKSVSYVFGDLRDMYFKDGVFDNVVSLSTIEHIGLDNSMIYARSPVYNENRPHSYLSAIAEYKRVLKTGGRLYLSVPYGRHKNHGWFQVFNFAMIEKIKETFAPAAIDECYFRYTPAGWINSNAGDTGDCECFDINSRRQYDADYAAFSRAVACITLIK